MDNGRWSPDNPRRVLKLFFSDLDVDEMEVGESYAFLIVRDTDSEIQQTKDLMDDVLSEVGLDDKLHPVVRKTTRSTVPSNSQSEKLREVDNGEVAIGVERTR